MNAIPLQVELPQAAAPSIIVEKLKQIRGDKKKTDELAKAVGWSTDMAEKVCAGTAGVVPERMPSFLSHLGLLVTTEGYMDYLAQGNVIGSNCRCARANMGECGRR
ncbi:hypothetical protein [Burkholderia gladioli]|uniref:hypothetical protein n=1 Tax=Burkholderia gladioli TaxID=28095 RepID=UPI00163F8317|nr:hypothetical protein [Burkholderia gladioli]